MFVKHYAPMGIQGQGEGHMGKVFECAWPMEHVH